MGWNTVKEHVSKHGSKKQLINIKRSYVTKDAYKKSKDNNKKSGVSPQFCSFYDELDEVLRTRDAITLPSTLETGSANQNTSASTDLSSFVNSNIQSLFLDDENFKEENNNKNAENAPKKLKTLKDLWK